jgi:signal transduction histidine kinase
MQRRGLAPLRDAEASPTFREDEHEYITKRFDAIGSHAIVNEGKEAHFGLQGMRERAGRIMAKLTVETSTVSGTEIKLIVPGSIIYRSTISGRRI